jgi:hypothetical protein
MDARRNQSKGGLPSEDLVRAYQLEIGRHPLLSKDDEVRLARRIEDGTAARHELDTMGDAVTRARRRELGRVSRGLRRLGGASFKPISGWSDRDRRRTRVGPKLTAMDRLPLGWLSEAILRAVRAGLDQSEPELRADCHSVAPGSGGRNSGLSPNAGGGCSLLDLSCTPKTAIYGQFGQSPFTLSGSLVPRGGAPLLGGVMTRSAGVMPWISCHRANPGGRLTQCPIVIPDFGSL